VSEAGVPIHRLLSRQLGRLGLSADAPPGTGEEWCALLGRISASYSEADQDRYTMERSLEISSRELQELNHDLQASSAELALEHDKLQRSLATLHETLEASLDGILLVDDRRNVLNYNRRFLEIFACAEEQVRDGDPLSMIEHAALLMVDPDLYRRKVAEIYDSPTLVARDELLFKDGRIVERFSTPVHPFTGGTAFARVSFFRDVTERRSAEEEVRRMTHFLDSIVENIPHTIFVKDAESLRIVRFNRAGEELFGVGRDEVVGRIGFPLYTPAQAESSEATDREVLRRGEPISIEEELVDTRWRGRRLIRTKKIPIPGEDGKPRYLLGIARDITEEKLAEQQLRDAKETAERASRTKSVFLSNMSHEMRTPLNSIIGFARVLEGGRFGGLGDRQQEYVKYILRGGQHMLNMVNDLLDLRRLEEDREALAHTRVDLGHVVDEALQLVKALADEKGHRVAIELPAHLPDALADRRAVVQILVNLLSNAVKFTPSAGRITVRARAVDDQLSVAVEDSGIGIRPEDQPRLFTYFEQLGARHDHTMKGSGIGLALTRALVERLGGTISVSSAAGVGTTFEFSIPRWMEQAAAHDA
jgi:PAS domain S-box-containing protein